MITKDKTEVKIRALSKGVMLNDMYILILGEKDGDRIFPLPVSQSQNMILLSLLHHKSFASESLLDAFKSITNNAGMIFESSTIQNFENGIYQAEMSINHDGEKILAITDATTGVIMALSYRSSIYIDNGLFEMQYAKDDENSFSIPVKSLSTEMLKAALKDAISNENYELASMLRDEIKKRQ